MSVSANANTEFPCADCGDLAVVTVTQGVKFGGKWLTWRLCSFCYRKEAGR